MIPVPDSATVGRYCDAAGEKDAHVMAAAIAGKAEFLITLDKQLIRRVSGAEYNIRALTPGEFILTELRSHPEYEAFRITGA